MLDQVTILAPGLLGGSVAQALRARKLAKRIVIWARRPEVRVELAKQTWCDAVAATAAEAVREAAVIVLAPPVDHIVPLVREIAPFLREGAIVTDVGSVKGELCRQASACLPAKRFFVGAHPMAGSDKTGWENGSPSLFEKRVCFVTPLLDVPEEVTACIQSFWQELGMQVVRVGPDMHDEIVANISHLPQIIASTLCATLAAKNPEWRDYAGGGLRDTTRIAGSDSSMWMAILKNNRDEILRALKQYQDELQHFTSNLENKDYEGLQATFDKAREYRRQFRI